MPAALRIRTAGTLRSACGDYLRIYIKVKDYCISDIKFEIFTPGGDCYQQRAYGAKTLQEALKLTIDKPACGPPDPGRDDYSSDIRNIQKVWIL